MSRDDDPAAAASPAAALAARARSSPHDPWLFHREGWDWQWRSFRRAADQVARGVAAIGRLPLAPRARVGFAARQDPDAVAAGLAIQAAGAVAVPVSGEGRRAIDEAARLGCAAWAGAADAAAEPAGPLERVALPRALSPLDRTPLAPLALDLDAAPGALGPGEGGEVPSADLTAAARRLAARLPQTAGRPIVCAAPGIDPVTAQVLAAWTLLRGAAWVLEPLPEAFVPTALWARPTLVLAGAGDLARLAEELGGRRRRRFLRLSAAGLVGSGELAAPARRRLGDLGIALVALGEKALHTAWGRNLGA